MDSVLLTGFEPFGGETINPSWEAVRSVGERWDGPETVHVLELPVDFTRVGAVLRHALATLRPTVVICVGQAGGATGIRLERIAINVDDARIPDNSGFQPVDEAIVPGGPAGYFTALPIKAALAGLLGAGIPASVSQSAGTYTCNHVFYLLMHELATNHPGVRGGFVHVPYSADQVAGTTKPSLPPGVMAEAIEVVVHTTLSTHSDVKIAAGALD